MSGPVPGSGYLIILDHSVLSPCLSMCFSVQVPRLAQVKVRKPDVDLFGELIIQYANLLQSAFYAERKRKDYVWINTVSMDMNG